MLWHSTFYGRILKCLTKDCWPIVSAFTDRETTTKWNNLLKNAAKLKADGSLHPLILCCWATHLHCIWTWYFTGFPGLLLQLYFLRWNYHRAQIFLQYNKTSNLIISKGATSLLHWNEMQFFMKHVKSSLAQLQSECQHLNSDLFGRPCSKGLELHRDCV